LVPVVTVPPLSATAVVAVKAFPVHDPELPVTFPVTFPVNAPVKVVAVTVPAEEEEVPLLKLVAVVAVAAFPVHEPELAVAFPVTFPVKGPLKPVAYTEPVTPKPLDWIITAPVLVETHVVELLPPTNKLFATPIPPFARIHPVVSEVESVVL